MICANPSGVIGRPLPEDSKSAHGASHHAWAPHHRNPALNQTSNRRIRIQTVVNNLKFMIVGYLAAKKSGNLD